MYNPFLKKVLSDSNNIPVVTINNLKEKSTLRPVVERL